MTFLGLLAPEQGFEIRELPQLQWALPNNIKLFDVFYEDEGKLTEDQRSHVERYKPNKIEQLGPIFHNNYQFTASNIHLQPGKINKIIDDVFKNPLFMAFTHSLTDPYANPSAYSDVAEMAIRINRAPRPSFMEPTPIKQKRSFKYDPNLIDRLFTEDAEDDDIIWYDTKNFGGGYSSNQKRGRSKRRSIKRRSTKRRSNSRRRSKSNRRCSAKKRSAKKRSVKRRRSRSNSQRRRRS